MASIWPTNSGLFQLDPANGSVSRTEIFSGQLASNHLSAGARPKNNVHVVAENAMALFRQISPSNYLLCPRPCINCAIYLNNDLLQISMNISHGVFFRQWGLYSLWSGIGSSFERKTHFWWAGYIVSPRAVPCMFENHLVWKPGVERLKIQYGRKGFKDRCGILSVQWYGESAVRYFWNTDRRFWGMDCYCIQRIHQPEGRKIWIQVQTRNYLGKLQPARPCT